MSVNLQTGTEPGKPASEVIAKGRHRHVHRRSGFGQRPAVGVDEHNGRALGCAEQCQSGR